MAPSRGSDGRAFPAAAVDAVVFDLDGVITRTAAVHAAAWKAVFDAYLRERAERGDEPFRPFDDDLDYRRCVDGKPRYDGVRDFLGSRGIVLPEGDPSDPPERETVCGIGNRKNAAFLERLRVGGVQAYETTIAFIRELRRLGIRTAVISSSRNCRAVLEAAGVHGLFDARIDGVDAEALHLPGKPDPAIFLRAAEALGATPDRAAVVEDAPAGVEAGRRGGFAVVVGIDRGGHPDMLREAGATVVVPDLGELPIGDRPAPGDADRPPRRLEDLPSPLDEREALVGRFSAGPPVVFLDYDGTLTPIVPDPASATVPDQTRRVVAALAERCTVAVISGRDLDDVRGMLGLDSIVYAGSHGFHLEGVAGGRALRAERGTEFLPALDRAERALAAALEGIPGARVERKRFAVAVHVRAVPEELVEAVDRAVERVAAGEPDLRRSAGRKVFELRPALDWDKGRAVLWVLETLGLDGPDVVPVYVGDDVTDEDAFRALSDRGIGVVVASSERAPETWARYALRDTGEVRAFLQELLALADTGHAG